MFYHWIFWHYEMMNEETHGICYLNEITTSLILQYIFEDSDICAAGE